MWHTIHGNNPSRVENRSRGSDQFESSSGVSFPSTGEGWIHRVRLTSLYPDTLYEYRVSSDLGVGSEWSSLRTFRTAPDSVQAAYTFAFIADTGLHGRLDGNATGTRRIVEEVASMRPLFVLGGGDYAYANRDGRFRTNPQKVDAWFNQFELLIAGSAFMPQYGNHEVSLDEKFEDWNPRFAYPMQGGVGKSYSFDVGSVHFCAFFMVNDPPADSELQWLEMDLSQARAKGASWLIVYHHEPVYASGRSHPSKTAAAERIIPILEKYQVDLNLSSHDQNYERTFPLRGHPDAPVIQSRELRHYHQGDGVIYCKISPSGKRSETGNRFSEFTVPQQPFVAVRNSGIHHFGHFEVEGRQEIHVKIYGVGEGGEPLQVIDTFTLSRNP